MQCKFGICCFLWNASYSLKCYIQKRFTEHLPLPSTGWRKSMSRRSTMPWRSFTCGDWMVSWIAVDPRLLNFTSWSNKQIRSAERISICVFFQRQVQEGTKVLKKNIIRRPCKKKGNLRLHNIWLHHYLSQKNIWVPDGVPDSSPSLPLNVSIALVQGISPNVPIYRRLED